MNKEIVEQYLKALKSGQKYYKNAESQGRDPYPKVLDRLTEGVEILQQSELGLVNIPAELITGTKTAGRSASLAGNFMPLLGAESEFAAKWMALCSAHLSDEGIRDPIMCYEYMGEFFVQEGNKRVSVLKSFEAPTIPGLVTRLVPPLTDDPERQMYEEFLAFYRLSGQYGIRFRKSGSYRRLQASLGLSEDQVWTEEERRSFRAGYARFREAFEKLKTPEMSVTPAEALLTWLEVYHFSDIKAMSQAELKNALATLLPDLRVQEGSAAIEVSTEPTEKEKNLVSRIISAARGEHLIAAFIYGFPAEKSAWTAAHEQGRAAMEERLGDKVEARTYLAADRDYYAAMKTAVEDGARLIFATTPPMIDDCRRIAAEYKNVKVLNCALSQPYSGVRTYYSRIYESKYIAGAIAGAMADGDLLGYVANYPIFGTPASINAFALGARLTNPRARIKLVWSCTAGDPVEELKEAGVRVISNRDAGTPETAHRALDYGLYKLDDSGAFLPLAQPCWHWDTMYEKIVRSVLDGSWESGSGKAINYWWGLASGVIGLQLADTLPDGVRRLAELLEKDLTEGRLEPFGARLTDSEGVLRCDGSQPLTPEEIMHMDWLSEYVDGEIPSFDQLLPRSQNLVRLLGVYREQIAPETVEKQI